MKDDSPERQPPRPESANDDAESWVVREDRGLSPEEEKVFQEEKSQNPDLEPSCDHAREAWHLLDKLPPDEAHSLLQEIDSLPFWKKPVWRELTAVAAILIAGFAGLWTVQQLGLFNSTNPAPAGHATSNPTTRLLPDGSITRLNAGTEMEVVYTEDHRTIRLKKGEAHFKVIPDPERPFLVEVNRVRVRAVGTAFNVQAQLKQIDVIVTDGTVQILSEEAPTRPSPDSTSPGSLTSNEQGSGNFVTHGQRAQIRLNNKIWNSSVEVSIYGTDSSAVEKELAWQRPLLTLGGDTLGNIADDFEKKTGLQLIIKDPSLLDLRIGGRFPSDDPHGFLHILKTNYGFVWVEMEDGTLVIESKESL